MRTFIFRADASTEIGSGHVMRCISLAEELRILGATIKFVTRNLLGNLDNLILSKNFEVLSLPNPSKNFSKKGKDIYTMWLGTDQATDAKQTIRIIESQDVEWIIVDHYALDYNWEDKIKPYSRKIMVIDDLSNRIHHCDLLLDQNYIYDDRRYDGLIFPETTKLLGPKYALLRREFLEVSKKRMQRDHSIKSVFVFFGGSDPYNLTSLAMKALSHPELEFLSVFVLVGSANKHIVEIEKDVKNHPNAELHVQVENVAEFMAKSDIALGAGGSTTWERLVLGLPSIVVTVAENQVPFTKELDKDGFLNWLGNDNQVTENDFYNRLKVMMKNINQLKTQSIKGQNLVDGKGAQIVSNYLITGPDTKSLVVRKAKTFDCSIYWRWANDTDTRKNAFSQQVIEWHSHQEWFNKRLDDPYSVLLVIESDFGPIGQVRFERENSFYKIDYSLARQFRGFGLGKVILKKSIEYLCKKQSISLIGEVKKSNKASIKIFNQLGFIKSKTRSRNGMYSFLLKCSQKTFRELREEGSKSKMTEETL